MLGVVLEVPAPPLCLIKHCLVNGGAKKREGKVGGGVGVGGGGKTSVRRTKIDKPNKDT